MPRGIVVSSLKYFAVDFVGRLVYWPLWWYSVGLERLVATLVNNIREEERQLGIILWWRNLFVPMYGQRDWQGRLISFIMRIFVGLGRVALFCLWVGLMFVVLALWVALLPVSAYFILVILAAGFDLPWY